MQTLTLRVDDVMKERLAKVTGALDVFSSPVLPARALAGMPDTVRSLVIDLREVSFVDSAGVSALVKLRHDATARALDVRALLGEAQYTINSTIVELLRRILPVED